MMRFTSGQKPMSSMRSASSRTSVSTLVEQDVALAQHVEQAAGRGDQQIDAAAHLLRLRVVGHAAEDGDDAAAAVGGERLADLLDLRRTARAWA